MAAARPGSSCRTSRARRDPLHLKETTPTWRRCFGRGALCNSAYPTGIPETFRNFSAGLPRIEWGLQSQRNKRVSETECILIIDDDREIRDLVSRFLSRHGYKVLTGRDEKELQAALGGGRI